MQQKKFKALEQRYDCTIILMKVDNNLVEGFPLNHTSHLITKPTYYRLLVTEVLPNSVSKVIYFDCDVIVSGDIKPLWDTNMQGKSVAVVTDCGLSFNDSYCKRLGLPFNSGYFNAGMLVMNLDYWRDNDIFQQTIQYVEKNATELTFMDQDVLNGLLYNCRTMLPERYNFQTSFFFNRFWKVFSEERRSSLIQESKKVVVIHYCGAIKPWQFKYHKGAFYSHWNHYRKKSLWKQSRSYDPIWKYVKYTMKKLFFPRMLAQQMNENWVMLPCNEGCYL